ncbi:MAG: PIN domain-containing protein [Vicinamibacterales bacterium]
MIGLNTNVLVRFLTHDDPAQYEKVAAFIDAATDRGEQFVVNTAVLCELVWVLGTAYDYSRVEIAEALDQIFATAQFEIECLDEARQALGTSAPRKLTTATR